MTNERMTAFLIGFSAVMLGVILYHVLLADELAEVRFYRLRDEIRKGLEELANPPQETDLTPAPAKS